MSSRLIPVLLAAAVLAFACGPHSRTSESAASTPTAATLASVASVAPTTMAAASDAASPASPASPDDPVASALDVRVGKDIRFFLRVTNHAEKRVELTFPSGQTHDIVVLDTIGREVWRWSDGRIFTQALQNRVLGSSETVSYAGAWAPERRGGTYVAVASLRSENYPVEQRVRFTLP
jgi:hypothetical protein